VAAVGSDGGDGAGVVDGSGKFRAGEIPEQTGRGSRSRDLRRQSGTRWARRCLPAYRPLRCISFSYQKAIVNYLQ
jgi:hypothetical protein